MYCHAPPDSSKEEAAAYNDAIYAPDGSKFFKGKESPSLATLDTTGAAQSSINANTGRATVSQVDRDFFTDKKQGSDGVLAKTIGKYADGDFRRVNAFPHQSAYILAPESIVEGMSVGGATSASTNRFADGSMGKKSHKTGKRRTKDRSWRAE